MQQESLFQQGEQTILQVEHFEVPNAELSYYPQFFSAIEASQLFEQLQKELVWEQHHIRIAGMTRAQPRLSAWYGDSDAAYSYSGLQLKPIVWHPALNHIRQRIESLTSHRFNSVLANLYRDHIDSMGWHADNEPELGIRPLIASVSLGCSREFLIRHNNIKSARHKIALAHGSLLLMGGDMQTHWQHAIAKQKETLGPRINLTFRLIHRS